MALDAAYVRRERRAARRRRVLGRVALYVIAVLAALLAAGPFLWSAVTTFKQNSDLYDPANNPFIFNEAPPWSTSSSCCSTPRSARSWSTPRWWAA